MATHRSILDWRIPWIEEPCRLQSTVSQRETRLKRLSTCAVGVESWEEWGESGEGPGHPPLWWFVSLLLGVLRLQSQHSSFLGLEIQ